MYAEKAGLGPNYRIIEYPRKRELAELLQDLFDKVVPGNTHVRVNGLAGKIAQRLEGDLKLLKTFNDPQGLYARLPLELSIH